MAKSILDDIIDNTTSKVTSNIKNFKKKIFVDTTDKMRNDAYGLLNKMRRRAIGTVESATDSMIGELNDLANQKLLNPVKDLYNDAYNRVNAIVDKNVEIAKQHLSGAAKTALNSGGKKFGLGNIGDSVVKVSSYTPTPVTRVGKLWSKAYKGSPETKWEYMDVISDAVDLPIYIKAALEESGYIADKYRGIQISRDLHFITRPVLEADNGGFYRSYAFFTRPNLNIVDRVGGDGNQITLVPEMANYPQFSALCMQDLSLASELCRDGAGKTNLFTLLNNYTKEVPPIRLSESNREGIKNMYGKGTPIPGIPEVYGEVDISVTFIDNGRGDIAKLMYLLSTYKSLVGREGFPMRSKYIKYRSIDYLMSLYIVTVDANWEIIGFGVAIGLMIAEPPTHFTQHKMDGFGKNDLLEEFTVNFKAATYFPMAPDYFDDFNRLSGFDPSNIVDTRGSGHALYASDRQTSTKDTQHSMRNSIWIDTGGLDSSGKELINQITGTSIRAAGGKTSVISQIYENDDKQTLDQEVNVDNAVKGNRDLFEFAARNPGIYTSANSKEFTRRRFKLGFSY